MLGILRPLQAQFICQDGRRVLTCVVYSQLLIAALVAGALSLVAVNKAKAHDDGLDAQCADRLFPSFLPDTFQFDTPGEDFLRSQ
ncbi:hypothetical protein LshimejAT787_0905250 [Lyophyllum shimeji]|uniref:Uncharacterized protein n=1 Tax=Lyophyllum shimeji TaxID=47721 RepID=A0A9P3PRD0_LYOSH|nr:hypothetical protein LshimejAT787_0905250 [Lyophyllum shimeji]